MNDQPSKEGRSRGRPVSFCLERALEAATAMFSAKGYEETSLSNLTEAMGIARPSLYLHFGNKEELYLKAARRDTQRRVEQIATCLSAPNARKGVERYIRTTLEALTCPEGAKACFLTQAPLHDPDVTDKTRRDLEGLRNVTTMMVRSRLDKAVEDGQLPGGTSTGLLARSVTVLIQGLALEAQHGACREELVEIADLAMRAWPWTD